MSDSFRPDRAVRYACAVLADSGIGRLPVDPFRLAADVGITLVPLSAIRENPNWIPYNLPAALQMTRAVTLSYPTFCIVYRDEDSTPDQLRHVLCHELGHLFMNHYRDYPDRMEPGMPADNTLEAEADSFARNLLAPVPVVDVIRFNRPRQARASLFGLDRPAWIHRLEAINRDRASVDEDMANTVLFLFRDYLLARRCTACGKTFSDEAQTDRCPFCGAEGADWVL
ncbi:ImmA/IrrE family metallo-endopeptidase [Clostridiales bacterium]|nr:ImmA/IrrE family metallo-endopeptidase [Clostridiales bacterium]